MQVIERDELYGSMPTFARPLRMANASVVTGNAPTSPFQPLIARGDNEPLFLEPRDVVIAVPPINAAADIIHATEESRILSHPDVIAAIEAAIPDLEAWEKTL